MLITRFIADHQGTARPRWFAVVSIDGNTADELRADAHRPTTTTSNGSPLRDGELQGSTSAASTPPTTVLTRAVANS